MKPLGPQQIDAIEKAEAPPPEGSTAKKQCCVFLRGSRAEYSSTGASRASMSSTSLCANAFSEPSAEMPKDSRNLCTDNRQRRTMVGQWRQSAQHGGVLCARARKERSE